VLYVANSLDGTVSRLDAHSGRALGPALPVGSTPRQLVAGSGGSFLVLTRDTAGGDVLTHLSPTGGAGGAWATRPVPLPSPPPVHATFLAGDGDRHAVLVYAGVRSDAPRMVLVDAHAGTVEQTRRVPLAADEVVRCVALGRAPAGPVVYLGLWRWPDGGGGAPSGAGRGRILAVHAATGAVLGSASLAGAPAHLLAVPAAGDDGGGGHRLYAVQQLPGPGRADDPAVQLAPQSWELVGLDSTTLGVRRTHPLDGRPTALAGSPDGRHLYALAQPLAVVPGVAVTRVMRLDLAAGVVRPLADVPGVALGLAVTGERVYLPNAFGAEVWAIDRRSGRRLQTSPVGRHPTDIAVGGAPLTARSTDRPVERRPITPARLR
jgi:DNA-binding beta-propeller fold protein YncE